MMHSGERLKIVIQGEFLVSSDPQDVLSTILGSCVAAFMRDPVAGVGGLNHFLLPGNDPSDRNAMKYGLNAMELLINNLIRAGARRERLEAKLFGGGRMVPGLTDIGMANGQFAEDFLRREGISYLGGSLGGDHGRKIRVWPVSGQVQQMKLPAAEVREIVVKPPQRAEIVLF
ncbi:MAG: chemotaxis protein CheD [Pseudotabrizicola sp.]|uniref:chemotaxis protein CheD n=1 Tax=Pseudotabrizicola sp. TaxID=2939647 RepID=UPI00271D4D8D|nr:chemotaxis protein CheD [Pseudotabrizicola sp.]MDO8881872.1 chemotaxis protein CheD [Pseudotabrizicola sp.]MDP2079453.1 chemotaxis protein CheD [Pseudotabrizicola sp.]MDZ7573643.1 chemotaxis protein CheD [Pseudotabrizicola sp.]